MTTPYYQPSGRFSYKIFPKVLLATLVLLPFAWVYAWAMLHFYPFFQFFTPFIFYFCVAAACVWVCEQGQVRSPRIMLAVALAMCLTVWYLHWVFWACMSGPANGPDIVALLGNPRAVWALATAAPRWDGTAMAGALCELLFMVVLPAWMAGQSARDPFCEADKRWIPEQKLPRRFGAIAHIAHFTSSIEATPNQLLTHLPAYTDPAHYTTLSLYQGGGVAYVTIREVKETTDDGATSVNRTDLVTLLKVSARVGKQLAIDAAVDNAVAPTPTTAQAPAPAPAPVEEDEAPVAADLEPALDAMQAGDFAEAFAAALPYVGAADPQSRSDANRICALCCSREERWREAAAYWESVFACEGDGHSALQVATSKVMAGELAEGEEWIVTTHKANDASRDIDPFMIHTSFITALKKSGYLRAALPYLDWVKQAYETLHSTDATFLTLRHAPFFESFLEQSESIVEASMDRAQAHAWYASMLPHLDQSGQDAVTAWLARREQRRR